MFKPVDSAFVRREIKKTICLKFSMILDNYLSLEVEDDVLEKIVGGLWHSRMSLEEWIEKVLVPSFDQLKSRLSSGDRSSSLVRLVVESDADRWGKSNGIGNWLPSSIVV
ncbi:UNVERIFIED_CONTAM: protein SUPPRESSOR OF MAX2 1 [Sesamum radiatum]|uniref:Protein SUPPRESSOR OF MAX2 1 n=1 Tax=Sesamum radiatum TaxID=300843 RepID=A0AAW2LCX8_SESRA